MLSPTQILCVISRSKSPSNSMLMMQIEKNLLMQKHNQIQQTKLVTQNKRTQISSIVTSNTTTALQHRQLQPEYAFGKKVNKSCKFRLLSYFLYGGEVDSIRCFMYSFFSLCLFICNATFISLFVFCSENIQQAHYLYSTRKFLHKIFRKERLLHQSRIVTEENIC